MGVSLRHLRIQVCAPQNQMKKAGQLTEILPNTSVTRSIMQTKPEQGNKENITCPKGMRILTSTSPEQSRKPTNPSIFTNIKFTSANVAGNNFALN